MEPMEPLGTFKRPFAADSLWNSYPNNPVLGDFMIPLSDYYPAVQGGAYSADAFLVPDVNPPYPGVTILPLPGKASIWNADAETNQPNVHIASWPSVVTPAVGGDGHADVVDEKTGVIHSFYQLSRDKTGQWRCSEYTCSRIDGTGWGDPAHYMQGARSAGVLPMAGLIRSDEVDDGEDFYRHALAMSLTFNALSPKPNYIFPATSGDSIAATPNTGKIPEGALMMLPHDFDTSAIASLPLRKVAETLKRYGAYVVDRNYGTPFYIYVATGAKFDLHHGTWDNAVAAQLQRIRINLRQVVSAGSYTDANGKVFIPNQNLNILSLRGQWALVAGKTPGVYDVGRQAVVWPKGAAGCSQYNNSSRMISAVPWAAPKTGDNYKFTAITTGGAQIRFTVRQTDGIIVFDTGRFGDGQSATFPWGDPKSYVMVSGFSGDGSTESSIRGYLIKAV